MSIARGDIDLETHVRAATEVVEFEDLHNVVVVGHSYGAVVFTGVADQVLVAITTSNSPKYLLPALAPAPN